MEKSSQDSRQPLGKEPNWPCSHVQAPAQSLVTSLSYLDKEAQNPRSGTATILVELFSDICSATPRDIRR